MELNRRSVAWLIVIIGILFAFVTYHEYEKSAAAALCLAVIGVGTMLLLWWMASEVREVDDECSDWQPPRRQWRDRA